MLISILFTFNAISQVSSDLVIIEQNVKLKQEIKGLVLNLDNKTALPYANIYVLNKGQGVITNENGEFVMDISKLEKTDTLRFQYIGYKTRNISIAELDTNAVIYLKEDIINLTETLIFGSAPNAKSIVRKVLENKEKNYKRTNTAQYQTFIRDRSVTEFEEVNFEMKKSSFEQLNKDVLQFAEDKIPKYSTSYTDFLGDLYFPKITNDSSTFKIDPKRVVSLKEKDIDDLDKLENIFNDLFANPQENEYWKVKSGIISQKVDLGNENDNDTIKKDTTNNNQRRLKYFHNNVGHQIKYSLLDDDDDWEFLHKISKYKYSLEGGTSVNGEDVYIIDFLPRRGGKYLGRMFISTTTYALIRADYEFAPESTGTDIHMFGVGYTENKFMGSIYFEKRNGFYNLKYLSKKTGSSVSFDRNVALLKKSKRMLFDKKLNEIKVGINIIVNNEESIELLVLEEKEITDKKYTDFKEKEKMDVIYVDQFDNKLWKGFAIIEPTSKMREYKKQEAIYLD